MALDALDQALLAQVQDGLPLVTHPYAAIARQLGISEARVMQRLASLMQSGVIKRMGVVVRHRELGFRANAMWVLDIPDEEVARIGEYLGGLDRVTLCYQRPRRLPQWPYNLFCMIHGRDRRNVLDEVAAMIRMAGLEDIPNAVLFSRRCYKQRGARYTPGVAQHLELAHG